MSETMTPAGVAQKPRRTLTRAVIRFAGDSGDGMQLTGDQFTDTSAIMGNDIATLPDFPAEIRAPQGTLPGVSSFRSSSARTKSLPPVMSRMCLWR